MADGMLLMASGRLMRWEQIILLAIMVAASLAVAAIVLRRI
jgi:hypothetical protein